MVEMVKTGRSLRVLAAAALTAATLAPPPAAGQSLIRDSEIEHALKRVAAPLASAAGLGQDGIRILVMNDPKLNAFVIDPGHILINSGLLLLFDRVEELQAVIAHEIAHIANGHISRRIANARAAGEASSFGLLLGAAIAASSGSPDAGLGVALGTASSAQRNFLAHTRAEEAAADQSALRYMSDSGIDPGAMAEVLERFRSQEALSVERQDPYVRSHPPPRDRIRAVQVYASSRGSGAAAEPESDYWFRRAQGKLGAFLRDPDWTLRNVRESDESDVALVRRAIAHHREPQPEAAIAEMDKLIARRPDDAFAYELKGQILLESRQPKAAVAAYARAAELRPKDALILAGHGRALLALGDEDAASRALAVLERARSIDSRDPRMMRDLALAHSRTGNDGMASLATAERYALLRRLGDAKVHAKRAADALPQGSAGWNRARDVLQAAEAAERKE